MLDSQNYFRVSEKNVKKNLSCCNFENLFMYSFFNRYRNVKCLKSDSYSSISILKYSNKKFHVKYFSLTKTEILLEI